MKKDIGWTLFLAAIGAVLATKDAVIDPTKVAVFALVGGLVGFSISKAISAKKK